MNMQIKVVMELRIEISKYGTYVKSSDVNNPPPTRKSEQGVTSKCSFGADSVVVGDLGLVYTDCKRAGPVPFKSFCSKKTPPAPESNFAVFSYFHSTRNGLFSIYTSCLKNNSLW